jgi:hypothetical protein
LSQCPRSTSCLSFGRGPIRRTLFPGYCSPVYVVDRIPPGLFGISQRFAIAVSAVLFKPRDDLFDGQLPADPRVPSAELIESGPDLGWPILVGTTERLMRHPIDSANSAEKAWIHA